MYDKPYDWMACGVNLKLVMHNPTPSTCLVPLMLQSHANMAILSLLASLLHVVPWLNRVARSSSRKSSSSTDLPYLVFCTLVPRWK